MKEEQIWALTYEDEGPRGICSPSLDVQMSWRKLFIFKNYDKMKEFANKLSNDNPSRVNPRIIGTYHPEPYAIGEINFIREE